MIVVKIGGSLLESSIPEGFLGDVKNAFERFRLVLVHGGGKIVTNLASKLGKEQVFVTSPQGFRSRYTDRETVEIYAMGMAGLANKALVSALASREIPAVGISGLDGPLIRARRKKDLIIVDEKGRKKRIDGGYTGTIVEVDRRLLEALLNAGFLPVVAPLAIGEEFEFLNVDGDRAAAQIAGAMGADVLGLLTDVRGLILDGEVAPKLTKGEAEAILGKVGPGMITKVHAAIQAIEKGVGKVVIGSGQEPEPIRSAVELGMGTVIVR
ncbi:MAG: [LysW]-aminoadipate/[LysW]-glutamate kinase [Candidatus Bathyarchaeia archaeon]